MMDAVTIISGGVFMRKGVVFYALIFLLVLSVGGASASTDVKLSSKYNLTIYGKIKFDAIYDTNNMGRDEFITFIPKNADGKDKSTFNVRDTRIGVAIEGPSLNGWQARGRFEADFYGSDPSSNGSLRIRLAYIDFEKASSGTSVRIGQDWNKIAALNPTTVDFAIMGYNGNLWNRVPQITVTQDLGAGFEGLVTVYRYRNSDDDDVVDAQIHMPWVGAKLAYSGMLIDPNGKAYFALGGAVRDGEAGDNDVTPFVTAIEMKIPLIIATLTGEGYYGQGIGVEYFHKGGSFNVDGNAILTKGGFLQLTANPVKKVTVNVGYGADDPKNADVNNDYYNYSEYTFGNVIVSLMKDISAGIEAAYVETDWTAGKEHGVRYQAALWYNW
jgi:hypothetical protein